VFDLLKFVFMLLCFLLMVVFFGALLHLVVTTPAEEFLAQLHGPALPHHPQDRERQRLADRAMEAEIAERLHERRPGRRTDQGTDHDPDQA
jgi:hypothetical protein